MCFIPFPFLCAELFKGMIGISLEIQGICKELAAMIGNYLQVRGNIFLDHICLLKHLDGQFYSCEDHSACIIQHHTHLFSVVLLLVCQSIWTAEGLDLTLVTNPCKTTESFFELWFSHIFLQEHTMNNALSNC